MLYFEELQIWENILEIIQEFCLLQTQVASVKHPQSLNMYAFCSADLNHWFV